MELKSALQTQIQAEISDYFNKRVQISDGNLFSQNKLIKRILQFENHIYPTGKFTKQGDYKYWYDIITPRIDAEVKNTDIDTKNIRVASDRPIDEFATIVVNCSLKKYLKDTGQSEELNTSREQGAGWGNIVWKKIKKGYERVDLKRFYVINQTAENLTQSPAIEGYQLSQSDLRAKSGSWKNVEDVIKGCGQNLYSSAPEGQANETTTPYYDIYERNGEVCLKDLKTERNETPDEGDDKVYVLAKVIIAAVNSTSAQEQSIEAKYTLFADRIYEMPYEEYHRSRYKGKWFREGIIELLFDLQVRANQIGNQIAQGLEWSSKTIFRAADKLIVNNILNDLKNGDIIKSQDLQQIPVRMEGFDQLANEWNRILNLANDICNSREVVQGITPPSGTPLGTTQLLNTNSNKLFDFIREKFAIPLTNIFENWIIPKLVGELKEKDIVSLTGDTEALNRARELIINSWYLRNLIYIGPHTKEEGDALKQIKLEELKRRPKLIVSELSKLWEGFLDSVYVDISGEQTRSTEDTATLVSLIQLESDPARRSYLVEMLMKKSGLDLGDIPKLQPIPIQQPNKIMKQPSAMAQVAA